MWKTPRYSIEGALSRLRGLKTHSAFKSFGILALAEYLDRKPELSGSLKVEKLAIAFT